MYSEIKNRNLSLLTDLYELMMMQGYFNNDFFKDKYAVFDVFYRKNPYGNGFSVFSGLTEIVDYIDNLKFTNNDIDYLNSLKIFTDDFLSYLKDFKWTGSIYAFNEGSLINKKEPIIKIEAKIIEAQLIEGAILSIFNHQTLIATKAYRVCKAAGENSVMEFGLRRAHSIDSSIYGAKASVISGCVGTSNVLAAKMFDIIPMGTQAHSWIMSFDTEYDAFLSFAKMYPDMCILLVDTYDTLKSGVKNAIKTFEYMRDNNIKSKKYGIRIDSGDLAYLSKEARKMLDDAGFKDAIICASNDLDENIIMSLKMQGAKIDLYGVGTKMITGDPVCSLGGVYKLSALYDKNSYKSKIKISENSEKITNPGNKEVYRIYNSDNMLVADLLTLEDENISNENDLELFDPIDVWKKTFLKKNTFTVKKMLNPVILNGKNIYNYPSIKEIQTNLNNDVMTFREDYLRLINPKEYHVDLSKKLYDLKNELLKKYSEDKFNE